MKRVLIVKLGAIGDVAMAVSAVHQLYLAGFEINWICGNVVRPLLACYSWINVIAVDDKQLFAGSALNRMRAVFKVWRLLAGERYDLCAVLYYDWRYRILTPPWIAPRKVYLSHTDRRYRLLPGRHHSDEFARILLGRQDSVEPHSLPPVRPDRLPESPLPAKAAPVRIGIVPAGASNMIREQALRRWPIDSYVILAEMMIRRGWEVVLLGGPDDEWARKSFKDLAVIDSIGRLTLPQVVSAFDSCDVVVSHDTGPLHLAGLSHAALVGLFGPTQASSRLPRRDNVTGITGGDGFACAPCYDGRDFAPCLNNACMQQITPQSVMRAVEILLRGATQEVNPEVATPFPMCSSD